MGTAALPDVNIGGYQDQYERLLGASRFCLVPKGLGYWTHRLYEAALAGCIPVILADAVVVPFQGVRGLDWTKFSIKWPQNCINVELYHWLRHVDSYGEELKIALDSISCW